MKPVRNFYGGVMVTELVSDGVFMISGNFAGEARSFRKGEKIKLINEKNGIVNGKSGQQYQEKIPRLLEGFPA